jgi:CheY-like chemotaxis protein
VLGGVHVLAVDDDLDNLELLEAQLRLAGAEVVAAPSAGDALEAFTRRRPDVVVTDIGMPGEDGYWLLEQIAGVVPVIALTAFGRRDEQERARVAGFAAHLSKPIEVEHLVSVVLDVLAARR